MLAVLLAAPFMAQADATIANAATPSIRVGLGASGAAIELVIGGYLIAFAVLLITGARLGQTHGYRTRPRAGDRPVRDRAVGRAVTGQILGGALISANLAATRWQAIFLISMPVGLLVLGALIAGCPPMTGGPHVAWMCRESRPCPSRCCCSYCR